MRILYSFNKGIFEAKQWEIEIRAASDQEFSFIPFNHGIYLEPSLYDDSVKLDRLYQARDSRLLQIYSAVAKYISDYQIDVLFVTNCPPYHPDFMRRLSPYKVLYSTDDPPATYMRTIPYLHAYQQVMYCAQGYSPDMDLGEKLRYCGMADAAWLPLGVMNYERDPMQTEDTILNHPRDIDVIYVGKFWRQKLDLLFEIKKHLSKELRIYGMFGLKHNVYVNCRYGFPGWVRPISFEQRVRLYQRAKIGINIHYNEHALGNQRLYHLPANGVMQLCDCESYLDKVMRNREEVISYRSVPDLVDKVRYFLRHQDERSSIALNGFRRIQRDYCFSTILRRMAEVIRQRMRQTQWPQQRAYCN